MLISTNYVVILHSKLVNQFIVNVQALISTETTTSICRIKVDIIYNSLIFNLLYTENENIRISILSFSLKSMYINYIEM